MIFFLFQALYVYVRNLLRLIAFSSCEKIKFMKGRATSFNLSYRHLPIILQLVFHHQFIYARPLIKGLVTDNAGKPLYNANVLLLNASDSSKGALRFNVNDAFNTIKYKHSVNMTEQKLVTTSRYLLNFRTFKLTYSRNFGNDKLKANGPVQLVLKRSGEERVNIPIA